jgi:hypothetical protein
VPDGYVVPAGNTNVKAGNVGNVSVADAVTVTYASGVNVMPIEAGMRFVDCTAGTPLGLVVESVAVAVPVPPVVAGTAIVPPRPDAIGEKVLLCAVAPALSVIVDVAAGVGTGVATVPGTVEPPPPPPPQAVSKSESATSAAVAGANLMPVMEVHRSEADSDRDGWI